MREEAIIKVKADMDKYQHRNTLEGVTRFVDENIMAKADLTELLTKMDGYNGNHQVVFEEEFARDIDIYQISAAVDKLYANTRKQIVTRMNAEGKTIEEAIVCPLDKVIKASEEFKLQKIEALDDFNYEGEYRPSVSKYIKFKDLMDRLRGVHSETIDNVLERLQEDYPELKVNKGMKTSRLLNRVFEEYGVIRKGLNNIKPDERTEFEKKYMKNFAEYSDLINPKTFKRKVVISTNPIDFLRMSFGNTWCSCHNIDKRNIRNTSGMYSDGARAAGTVSYALDGVTFIMYVVPLEADESHPEDTDKIYRCLFHYQDGNLIQGRVYPQSKDGQLDLQKKLRQLMQQKLCEALEIPFVNNTSREDTWKLCGPSYNHNGSYNNGSYNIRWKEGDGQHAYPDWTYSYSGPLSYIKNFPHVDTSEDKTIVIGNENVCMYCGKYESESRITISNGQLSHTAYECPDDNTLPFH